MAQFLTARELALYLAISEGTLANWRVNGDGPKFIRVGRSIRYRTEDVETWLAGREARSTTEADHRGDK